MTRYLRIAAAIVFAMLALAFAALWVRSYFHLDRVFGPIGKWYVAAWTDPATVHIRIGSEEPPSPVWAFYNSPVSRRSPLMRPQLSRWDWRYYYGQGFNGSSDASGVDASIPIGILFVLSFAAFALLAFKRWRFTVRGLLIATTLIAVALGRGVYFL